jgi:hypothetical protein
MDKVDHVYFSYLIDARHLEAATNIAVVARECGVEPCSAKHRIGNVM